MTNNIDCIDVIKRKKKHCLNYPIRIPILGLVAGDTYPKVEVNLDIGKYPLLRCF